MAWHNLYWKTKDKENGLLRTFFFSTFFSFKVIDAVITPWLFEDLEKKVIITIDKCIRKFDDSKGNILSQYGTKRGNKQERR